MPAVADVPKLAAVPLIIVYGLCTMLVTIDDDDEEEDPDGTTS